MKTILLIGSYGSGNLGDEALKEIALQKLGKHFHCLVLSGNPKEKNEARHLPFGFRSAFSFGWLKSFHYLFKCKAVVFAGGGLFTEHEGKKAIVLWSWHVLWARLFMKPVHFLGQSAGPLHSRFGKTLTKWAFSRAKTITVRDKISAETLRKLSKNFEPRVSTDLCFAFEVQKNHPTKKIAINLRPWGGKVDEFKHFTESLAKNGYELHYVSMDLKDPTVLKEFGEVEQFESFTSLIQFLSTCETCIGMRLHFLIAAALSGTKVLGLSYTQKVSGVLKDLNLASLDLGEMSSRNLSLAFDSAKPAKNISELHKEALALLEQFSI